MEQNRFPLILCTNQKGSKQAFLAETDQTKIKKSVHSSWLAKMGWWRLIIGRGT